MLKYFILFLFAIASSLFLTPLVRFVALRLGALDVPDWRKVHHRPIPRLGGLSIFIVFNLVFLFSYQFDFFFYPPNFLAEIRFGWLLLASAIIFLIGAVDDCRKVPAGFKFCVQIIAGLIVALAVYRVQLITLPFGQFQLGSWSIPVTVLWIVAITNALNLLDGLDGLAVGASFIVSLSMFGISILNGSIGIALISVILAGSALGFLRYNFHPASIFLGDSGAYFLGFTISVLSLLSSLKGTTTFAILIPMIALGLPIMETALSMLRRLAKSLHIMEVDEKGNAVKFFFLDGWSMFRADREHIHHRLLKIGFTQKKAVMMLYGISLILGGLAFSSVYFKNINYALLITSISIATYVGVRKLGYNEIQIVRNGILLPLFDSPAVGKGLLRASIDITVIALSYYFALLLRFEWEIPLSVKEYYLSTLPLILFVKMTIFYLSGLNNGVWRYTNVSDLIKMFKAVILGCVVSSLLLWMIPVWGILSRAVLFIDFNLLLLFVIGARSSYRILEYLHLSKTSQGRKVLIYGVEKGSVHALNEFISNPRLNLSPVGFIDDDQHNLGKQINGYPVLGTIDSLEMVIGNHPVSEIIVSRDDIPKENLVRLSEICSSLQIHLRRFQTRLEEIPM